MRITEMVKVLAQLVVRPASAHCNTQDGPVVVAGRRALTTGNLNHALVWVHQDAEGEVRAAYVAAATALETERTAAELRFLETLVRLHRAGEGAGFTGIKPAGTPQAPAVTAADEALAEGTLAPLEPMLPDDQRAEVARRFATTLALRDYDVDDVAAGRDFVGAYVDYVHYAKHHAIAPAAVR